MNINTLIFLLTVVVIVAAPPHSSAQTDSGVSPFGAAQELPLYEGVAPGSEKWDYPEITVQGKSGPQVKNVVRPTLLYFPAAHPVGTAMIVAPGGGNRSLMMSYEGVDIAKKLNEAGVDAFVLKYRLNHTGPGADSKEPAATGPQAGQNVRELSGLDGRRAVGLLRSRAVEFKLQPNRIGMIGFSAGGGPIRSAMDGPADSRPDFAAGIYATGKGETGWPVPAGAPPLFLAVSADDPAWESTTRTFLDWRKASLPVELHVFQMGAHGFVNKGGGADRFMDRVTEWMQVNGWLTKPAAEVPKLEEKPAHAAKPTTAGVTYFENHIRPLLAENCYSCHSAGKKQKGGLRLDSRAGWVDGGEQGPALVPGDADASLLIRAVRYLDPDLQMPPDDKPLSKEAVAHLEAWVKMGAPDPREGPAHEQTLGVQPSDPIAGRGHWAFAPLGTSAPPAVKSSGWPRSTIDAFILTKLESANLKPAEDADRPTLLRRIYFQLIGLPPTPAQVTAFVEDQRPDAYERVVDQLMASPQYGGRWGRHWLDQARYADSNGLDENFLFREAWRYRNWVIDAVNADLPFDRFLTEQLAGDLLPFESIPQRDQQRIAAGFLVVGPKILLSNNEEQKKMDVADELIDTVGRAVLGQTLGCARCHDHKFDPIPTSDYYALAGIFTSTQVVQKRHMLNEQRQMERLVGLGADGEERNHAYEAYWKEHSKSKKSGKQAELALELLKADDETKLADLVRNHAGEVAPLAADVSQPKAARLLAQKELLEKIQAEVAALSKIPPRAMIPADSEKPANEAIRLSGQYNRLGKEVPRGFLRVISDTPASIPEDHSGRLELAHWLTNPRDGAGHLAARVMANRVWHHLFGRGLVRTVDNFGRTGETPSHPELLDFLARELINSGWSVKHLVRQIVLTRTFTMSSQDNPAGTAVDPDDVLLWRAPRQRLEPEALRDAMLAVAGQLDLKPMESTVSYLGDQATGVGENKNRRRTDFPNRSVYLPVIRNDLPEVFDVFDFANPQTSTGMRPETMVATQGLFMLNDPSVMSAAEALARRLLAENPSASDAGLVDQLFQLCLGTPPTDGERADLLSFVVQARTRAVTMEGKDSNLQAWTLACQALFASSRFQTLD